jgi:hypothetical protein
MLNLLATLALALAPSKVDQFGPFRMDMPLDQAAAVKPGLDIERAPAGQIVAVRANDAMHIGAFDYSVTLRQGSRGAYTVSLSHRQPALSASDCLAAEKDLTADLESRYGPLDLLEAWNTPLMAKVAAGENLWFARSGVVVGKQTNEFIVVEKAGHSRLGSLPRTGFKGATWFGGKRAKAVGDYDVFVSASGPDPSTGPRPCTLVATIRHVTQAIPLVERFDASAQPLMRGIGVGVRYNTALAEVPPDGVKVDMDCLVSRATGAVVDCAAPESALGQAAMTRILTMQFSHESWDANDPTPLATQISVKFAPEDHVDLPTPADNAFVTNPVWMKPIDPETPMVIYPERALRMEKTAKPTLTCQIQVDGSLACPSVALPDDRKGFGFEDAAMHFADHLRAEPKLADGKPSAGAWVKIPVNFTF